MRWGQRWCLGRSVRGSVCNAEPSTACRRGHLGDARGAACARSRRVLRPHVPGRGVLPQAGPLAHDQSRLTGPMLTGPLCPAPGAAGALEGTRCGGGCPGSGRRWRTRTQRSTAPGPGGAHTPPGAQGRVGAGPASAGAATTGEGRGIAAQSGARLLRMRPPMFFPVGTQRVGLVDSFQSSSLLQQPEAGVASGAPSLPPSAVL
jgi:hypothetical protein